MTEDLTEIMSPEENELTAKRAELAALSDHLAEKELELEDLKLSLSRFQNRYFSEVGCKYVELDEMMAQIAEAEAKKHTADDEFRATAKEARRRAQQTASEFQGIKVTDDPSEERNSVAPEVKKLYRKIASLIHPDKATDEKSRRLRTRLMAELNEAYSEGDLGRMQEVLKEWKASPDLVTGEGTAAELIRVIRGIAQVRRRIFEIDRESEEVRASDLYRLMNEVRKAEAQGKDVLREMAEAVQHDINTARQKLCEAS